MAQGGAANGCNVQAAVCTGAIRLSSQETLYPQSATELVQQLREHIEAMHHDNEWQKLYRQASRMLSLAAHQMLIMYLPYLCFQAVADYCMCLAFVDSCRQGQALSILLVR